MSADRAKMLDRVRALLAKAESTEHPAEAEAFMAKAHELIQLHAIAVAELAGVDGEMGTTTLIVDEPYSQAKASIAGVLARHLGCHVLVDGSIHRYVLVDGALVERRHRKLYVTGTAGARESFEVVWTSVLAQATRGAMTITAKTIRDAGTLVWVVKDYRGYWAPPSTRTARDQYLIGFAQGLREQLRRSSVDDAGATKPGALVLLDAYGAAEAFARDQYRFGTRSSSKMGSEAGRKAGRAADVGRQRVGGQRALGRG